MNELIRGYWDLPGSAGNANTFTYDELAERYPYTLPENARTWQSWAAMQAAVIGSGSHYFDAEAVRFFRARSDRRLFGGRFWVESKQFESLYGEREPRTYAVAWVSGPREGEPAGSILAIEKWGEFHDLPTARGWCKRFAEAIDTEGS